MASPKRNLARGKEFERLMRGYDGWEVVDYERPGHPGADILARVHGVLLAVECKSSSTPPLNSSWKQAEDQTAKRTLDLALPLLVFKRARHVPASEQWAIMPVQNLESLIHHSVRIGNEQEDAR